MTVSSWRPQRDFEPGTSHRGKYNCSERAVAIRCNSDGLKSGALPDDVNVAFPNIILVALPCEIRVQSVSMRSLSVCPSAGSLILL